MRGKRLNAILDTLYRKSIRFLASDIFFYVILAIAILQVLWYALSIRTGINDETRHFSNIIIYSHHWTPFLGKQIPAWDHLGEITRDGSFMFYYVMSWPLRFIRLFTQNQTTQIIDLRLICAAFFVGGLVLYRRALLEAAKVSKALVHLAFLFFVLTPTVALLPATVNYDNLVFLLFALILLLAVRAVKSREASFLSLASILIVGLFMSVVKWTSMALFVPIVLYLGYDLYKKYRFNFLPALLRSARGLPRYKVALLIAGLVIVTGLFIERPVMNVLEYGKPDPSCQAVIGPKRCMKFPDYVEYANLDAHKQANFSPINPAEYFFEFWEPRMATTSVDLLEKGKTSELPVIKTVYDFFALIGVALLLVYVRDFIKNKQYRLLLVILAVYALVLILDEYQVYVVHGAPAAIRARYLIPVLPIFIYFAGMSAVSLFGKYRKSLLISVCLVLLLFTQGGSIITFSLTTPEILYWQNSKPRSLNHKLQDFLHPLVLGR
jgi:hypothetical protein